MISGTWPATSVLARLNSVRTSSALRVGLSPVVPFITNPCTPWSNCWRSRRRNDFWSISPSLNGVTRAVITPVILFIVFGFLELLVLTLIAAAGLFNLEFFRRMFVGGPAAAQVRRFFGRKRI